MPQSLTPQAPSPVREVPLQPLWGFDLDTDGVRTTGAERALFAYDVLQEIAKKLEDWELNGGEEYDSVVVTINKRRSI
jgi:hypothetical protein